jgi:hypothetical protein
MEFEMNRRKGNGQMEFVRGGNCFSAESSGR